MSQETLPRWGLGNFNPYETDSEKLRSSIFATYESITGRALAQGDPVRLFVEFVSAVVIQMASNQNATEQQNWLSYAQGQYLDKMGEFLQVYRLPESAAKTTIRFKLAEALKSAYLIPVGFEVTNGVVTFATDEDLQLAPGEIEGEVMATCTVTGAIGNGYLPDQIQTIVSPMAYLESATNTTETIGGADAESDAELAERIRTAPNTFSVAGPEKAYIAHTKSVSSAIIDVSATSPEPGIVEIYPLLEGGEMPSETILQQIDEYLNAKDRRPLTDFVQVKAPSVKEYSINLDYWIFEEDANKAETIKKAVEQAVEEYRLWQQTKIGRDILPAKLIQKVMMAGAARIDNATMSPSDFVQVGDFEVAQCTGVTLTYKGYKDI